ncbi:MAG: NFACT family protein, partial [Hymenobacteraceae bacterium]|nr:NFACT family protein [Hymenobacteraceae bacterium]
MHNNYYFLKQLTQALQKRLLHFRIATCFSQSKDELIIGLEQNGKEQYIKATLTAHFSALSFPDTFHRARANSVNLFKDMIGEKVLAIVQHPNERSFQLNLSNNKVLLFKLFGNRSNILLYHHNEPVSIFHKKFEKDLLLQPEQMGRSLSTDFETFLQKEGKVQALYPTFGDLPQKYLTAKGYDQADVQQKWELLQQVVEQLEHPQQFYLIKEEAKLRLSLLPYADKEEQYADPVEAVNAFVRRYLSEHAYNILHQSVAQTLSRRLHVA